MTYKNLVPGQWQIGDIVMGYGTNIKMESVDVKPYDIDDQDYQVSLADEKRFGLDSFKPTTIEFTMQVLHNRLLPEFENDIPNFWHNMPNINMLAREWRGDSIRRNWGQMTPMYVCSKLDGIPKIIFGRTGQFGATHDDEYNKGEVIKALGEFRRADTLAYALEESGFELALNQDPVYLTRDGGDGPDSWLRVLMYGPIDKPVVTIGDQQIEFDITLPEGKVIEVSSYPWQRRAVDSDRTNLSASLIGKTVYLDQLKIPYKVPTPIKWTTRSINTWVPTLGNQSWMEDIENHNLFAIPDTFITLAGRAAVRYDFFNFGSAVFPWITPRQYLAAGIFDSKTAVLYNAKKYATEYQYAEAKIVEAHYGKSAICIMSNETMTNYACAVVENTFAGRFLHIATGNSPTSITVRQSWAKPNLLGWRETDRVGIGFDPDTKTYTGYVNKTPVVTWQDNTDIVSTGTDNRSQGFLFDIDGNLLTDGIGFADIIAYDTKTELLDNNAGGRIAVLWRDTYTTI